MDVVFVTGTAGSGKSMLTKSLKEWYISRGEDVATVNLDPGALNLPYDPDIDIRTLIDIREIMDSHGLGPNGALILAADMTATRLNEIQELLDERSAEHVLVDTPGQMELFSFRESGSYIARELKADSKALLFLIDPHLANTPTNFLSLTLLSVSVGMRIGLPKLSVVTKKDIAPDEARRISEWSRQASLFEEALSRAKDGEQYSLYSELFRSLKRLSLGLDPYPISSVTLEGLIALVGELSRISRGGEELND